MNEHVKPYLFSLADALEMNMTVDDLGILQGSRKAQIDLFEGYSPVVISSITFSCVDVVNKVVAAEVQVWGNLGVVVVVEAGQSHVSLFVVDRSKTKSTEDNYPFDSKQWSRQRLYKFLEPGVKAIYHRSLFDTKWAKLANGVAKLKDYNELRSKKLAAREAYNQMWADI